VNEPDDIREIHRGRFLSLLQRGSWEYASRPGVDRVVGIVAVTTDDTLLVVEQHRLPVGGRCLELPAGLVGDEPGLADEGLLEGAKRELLEETGFASDDWQYVGPLASSAGLTDEAVDFFVARQARRAGAGGGVAGEAIAVHEVPIDGVMDWMRGQLAAGVAMDAKLPAGLWLGQMVGAI